MWASPDTRRGAPTSDRHPSEKSPRPQNLDAPENSDFRHNAQGFVRGNFRDADGIRRSLGLSWEEVVGTDHALAREVA